VSGATHWTYADLAAQTAAVAAALTATRLEPGELVGVVVEKGATQVAAVVGIQWAGGAYLPIEASLPAERVQQLLRESQVRRIVVAGATATALAWPADVQVIDLDAAARLGAPPAAFVPPAAGSPDDLAYVIYTSGSTGQPKGVMVTHRSAQTTIDDVTARWGVTATDRVLALSALGFDLSVYDVFGLLGAGGAVVLPTEAERIDPAAWAALLARHGVTVWNSVPALLDLLLDYYEAGGGPAWAGLRLVLLSGDWIPVTLPARIARVWPQARVVSLGGATEGAIWSIAHEVSEPVPADARSIPYGRALTAQTVAVVNAWQDRCPVWVPGEIVIGGAGVALGYWRNPARTALQFVPDPAGTGTRWYRTGDRGRYLPSGEIEILGRLDQQVKIHGHRIELGEIEHCLQTHPDVAEAVALAVGPARSARRLVAAVRPGPHAPDAAALRQHVADRLPAYMVPERVLVLATWPLTANGKVDREALARLAQAGGPGAAAAPRGPWATVARAMQDVLACGPVAAEANFFALGGDSLSAVKLLTRLRRELSADLKLRDIFDHPVVADLAALGINQGASIEHVSDDDVSTALTRSQGGL